jgi:hypothetical protein
MTPQEIKPTYVTFEQAKKLKDKGFDLICHNWYSKQGFLYLNQTGFSDNSKTYRFSAPEQWQVVEWLRVNYNIEMWVAPFIHEGFFETPKTYSYFIYSDAGWENDGVDFESPQEAYLAAFDYILNNNLV